MNDIVLFTYYKIVGKQCSVKLTIICGFHILPINAKSFSTVFAYNTTVFKNQKFPKLSYFQGGWCRQSRQASILTTSNKPHRSSQQAPHCGSNSSRLSKRRCNPNCSHLMSLFPHKLQISQNRAASQFRSAPFIGCVLRFKGVL